MDAAEPELDAQQTPRTAFDVLVAVVQAGCGALAALLLLLVLTALADVRSLPLIEFWKYGEFPTVTVLHLLIAGVVLGFGSRRLPPVLLNLAVAGVLASMYCQATVPPLGDHDHWMRHAEGNLLFGSEILAGVVYAAAFQSGWGVKWVPPAFGFLTAFLALTSCECRRECPPAIAARTRLLTGLAYLGWSGHLLYFRNYVENTQLSLPALMLFIMTAVWYLNSRGGGTGILCLAAACWSMASMFHGQNVFLAPAFVFLVALRRWPEQQPDWVFRIFLDLWLAGIVAAVTAAALWAGVAAAGFDIVPGNVNGGGDGLRFVPLTPANSPYVDFAMFSWAHLRQYATFVTLACPALAIAAWSGVSRRFAATLPAQESLFLLVLTFGYLGFAWLWNFDLGLSDLDLMTSLSLPLLLLFCRMLVHLPTRLAAALLVGNLLYVWGTLSLFLR